MRYLTLFSVLTALFLLSCSAPKKQVKIKYTQSCSGQLIQEIHYNKNGDPTLEIGHATKFEDKWYYEGKRLVRKTEFMADPKTFYMISYFYDEQGQLDYAEKIDTIDKSTVRIDYEFKDGQMVSKVFSLERVVDWGEHYTYDSEGRLAVTTEFFYSEDGDKRTKLNEVYTYHYNDQGQLIGKDHLREYANDTQRETYTLNDAGDPIEATFFYSSGEGECDAKYEYVYY